MCSTYTLVHLGLKVPALSCAMPIIRSCSAYGFVQSINSSPSYQASMEHKPLLMFVGWLLTPVGSSSLQIKAGTWFDDDSKAHNRKHKTQFQELVGYYLPRGGTKVVAVMMFCMWFGVGKHEDGTSCSGASWFQPVDLLCVGFEGCSDARTKALGRL